MDIEERLRRDGEAFRAEIQHLDYAGSLARALATVMAALESIEGEPPLEPAARNLAKSG